MEKKNIVWSILSIIFLAMNLYLLFVYFRVISHFEELFKGFNATLPPLTVTILVSRYFFIIIGLVLIAKEFLKNKLKTFIINVCVLIILLVLIPPFYSIGLLQPLNQLSSTATTK